MLNIQTTVSLDFKIINVVTRWQGSCDDQTKFKNH